MLITRYSYNSFGPIKIHLNSFSHQIKTHLIHAKPSCVDKLEAMVTFKVLLDRQYLIRKSIQIYKKIYYKYPMEIFSHEDHWTE